MPARKKLPFALDAIDILILRALQRDARLSARDLADAAGLSRSAVWERRQKLEHEGVIVGYQAVLAPQALATGMDAFIRYQFAPQIGDHALFFQALQRCDLICSAQALDGLGGVQIRIASPKAIQWLQHEITACGLEVRGHEIHFVVEDIAPHRAPLIGSIVDSGDL